MATAQYETRTELVEKTLVVLELTEDEADELKDVVEEADGTRAMVAILRALRCPEAPKAAEPVNTYTYGGIVYELGAKYCDNTDDYWAFELNAAGEPRSTAASWESGQSLQYAVDSYGPLTKVPA